MAPSSSSNRSSDKSRKADDDDFVVVASAVRSASTKASTTASEGSSVKKRKTDDHLGSKTQSLFPLFNKKMSATVDPEASSSSSDPQQGAFVWLAPLGPSSRPSCLRASLGRPLQEQVERRKGVQGQEKVKVACFDLDGCLVVPRNGKSFPSATDEYDFEETRWGVFKRVKEEYQKGACIAIVSNQKQTSPQSTALTPSSRLKTWKSKLAHIAHAIDCPMLVLAALSDDGFRKPGRAMWDKGIVDAYVEVGGQREDIEVTPGGQVQDEVSYFVGDAAGRPQDHNDTDRKWATNVGIPFYTPEEFFDGKRPQQYKITGWKPPADLVSTVGEDIVSKTLLPSDKTKPDIVVFVGPPASGKTSYFRRHFQPHGYAWVNQDKLKTAAKCQQAVKDYLQQGESVVIDNTNRNVTTRAPYIAIAKELGAQVRCVHFDVVKDLAWHNNLFRARAGLQNEEDARSLVPKLAFDSYYANLEAPKRSEGFDADIVLVPWAFDAEADAETKRRWLCLWD